MYTTKEEWEQFYASSPYFSKLRGDAQIASASSYIQGLADTSKSYSSTLGTAAFASQKSAQSISQTAGLSTGIKDYAARTGTDTFKNYAVELKNQLQTTNQQLGSQIATATGKGLQSEISRGGEALQKGYAGLMDYAKSVDYANAGGSTTGITKEDMWNQTAKPWMNDLDGKLSLAGQAYYKSLISDYSDYNPDMSQEDIKLLQQSLTGDVADISDEKAAAWAEAAKTSVDTEKTTFDVTEQDGVTTRYDISTGKKSYEQLTEPEINTQIDTFIKDFTKYRNTGLYRNVVAGVSEMGSLRNLPKIKDAVALAKLVIDSSKPTVTYKNVEYDVQTGLPTSISSKMTNEQKVKYEKEDWGFKNTLERLLTQRKIISE